MREYACPSCGAPVPFRSTFSVYAVCASCGSTVLRGDTDVSRIGEMADLPDDMSPLQVGTLFTWRDRRCELLGRTRMAWADGAWTEWFFDGGGTQGWLAEAQGFLSVAFERQLPPALWTGGMPALGTVLEVDGTPYRVSDLKGAICTGSEGELPFAAPRGRAAEYADMVGPGSGFAGLEESQDGRRLYVGAYAGFDELQFANLREVEGWPPPRLGSDRSGDPALPGQ